MAARNKPVEPEEVTEPEPIQPTTDQLRDTRFVKHFPHEGFSARLIKKQDWESIGVVGQETVEWNEFNLYMLPVSMFTDRALDYLLGSQDGGFKIVER